MMRKTFLILSICLFVLAASKVWATTYRVLGGEQVCAPKSYTNLGNGIVRDNVTSLEWQQATAPGTYTWQQALDYCAGLSLGGHSDWRLPDQKELQSLLDYCHSPAKINKTYFPDTAEAYPCYWSSTSRISRGIAVSVCLSFGWGCFDPNDDHNYVRAVRSGQ
jgi:hypothetical protein